MPQLAREVLRHEHDRAVVVEVGALELAARDEPRAERAKQSGETNLNLRSGAVPASASRGRSSTSMLSQKPYVPSIGSAVVNPTELTLGTCAIASAIAVSSRKTFWDSARSEAES